jgi:glycerophosphoryl diester phosphodiesterase
MRYERCGHRGARGLFPENTLEGFAATIALGVDSIELDVAVTADGIAVVSHDATLHPDLTRGPDGAWLGTERPVIRSLTFAELQRYDVGRLRPGSRFAALFPDQRPIDGARIPTLEAAFRATPGVRIDAELKTLPDRPELTVPPDVMAEAVIAAAEAAGALARLAIRSFDWRGLAHLRRTRPEIPLAWLTRPETDQRADLWWGIAAASAPQAVARAAGTPASWHPAWAPHHAALTPSQVAEAHALGLRVLPWTVNDPGDMARLLAWGVDGLCTDRPDLLP